MSEFGTIEDILEAEAPVEEVIVPEFGGKKFRVRGMSGAERERYEQALGVYSKNGEVRSRTRDALARLVAMSLIDAEGKRMFREPQVAKLAEAPAAGLARIADVARRLSGLTEADVEELAGNFESGQSESSSSNSHSLSVAPSMSSSTAAAPAVPSRAAN